jgi:hypothetical protein
MYCSKVAELFDDYMARWNQKQITPIGQFSVSRRGQMRVGNTSRYESLKRDQENATTFGFVSSSDEEEKEESEQKFEITSQHLEDNASICSSMH